jgi:hypothetical protein
MNLYKVSFTFCDSYSIKVETFVSIVLTVRAYSAASAQMDAWDKISPILGTIAEAKSITVEKLNDRC